MCSPYVSVIIPNYNHSEYLDRRIQSVLEQTYKFFEVIILDDASTDNSAEIINKYRKNHFVSHIVINEENSGSTFLQWNKGFQLSKGELIWIAESDDYCEPNFLECLVEAYQSNPENVVAYTSSQYVDSLGNLLDTIDDNDDLITYYLGREFIERKLAYGCAIWNASSAIFNKNIALSLNKKYQNYKACGDRLFWIMMSENGSVVHLNKRLNYFRQHLNKVSPRRFRDGTTLQEEYLIHNYICSRRYLMGFRRIFIVSLYYKKIINGQFNDRAIKENLLRLWHFNSILKVIAIKLLSRLYVYYHLYILRRKPL